MFTAAPAQEQRPGTARVSVDRDTDDLSHTRPMETRRQRPARRQTCRKSTHPHPGQGVPEQAKLTHGRHQESGCLWGGVLVPPCIPTEDLVAQTRALLRTHQMA